MTKRDNGGYAFPRPLPDILVSPDEAFRIAQEHAGMTLRDYFAAHIAAAMNASPALMEAVTSSDAGAGTYYERLARKAYEQSDALLRERFK